MSRKKDLEKLLQHDMISFDDDNLRLVGADIRTERDDNDYSEIEHEKAVDEFLSEVIFPRVIMLKEGTLKEPVWTEELVRWYQSIRNSARMLRPAVMELIKERRNYER